MPQMYTHASDHYVGQMPHANCNFFQIH